MVTCKTELLLRLFRRDFCNILNRITTNKNEMKTNASRVFFINKNTNIQKYSYWIYLYRDLFTWKKRSTSSLQNAFDIEIKILKVTRKFHFFFLSKKEPNVKRVESVSDDEHLPNSKDSKRFDTVQNNHQRLRQFDGVRRECLCFTSVY